MIQLYMSVTWNVHVNTESTTKKRAALKARHQADGIKTVAQPKPFQAPNKNKNKINAFRQQLTASTTNCANKSYLIKCKRKIKICEERLHNKHALYLRQEKMSKSAINQVKSCF